MIILPESLSAMGNSPRLQSRLCSAFPRQSQEDRRAFSRLALDLDPASLPFGQRPGDRQAQPKSLDTRVSITPEEPVKDMRTVIQVPSILPVSGIGGVRSCPGSTSNPIYENRRDTLSPAQAEIVRTLKEGLGAMAEKEMAMA